MTGQLDHSTSIALTPSDPPTPQTSAVDRCAQAWKRTYELASLLPKKERHEKDNDSFANAESARAFRDAMPPLLGFENIQEFIACVAYAQLHSILCYPECERLFECARFALTVIRPEPNKKSQKLP